MTPVLSGLPIVSENLQGSSILAVSQSDKRDEFIQSRQQFSHAGIPHTSSSHQTHIKAEEANHYTQGENYKKGIFSRAELSCAKNELGASS